MKFAVAVPLLVAATNAYVAPDPAVFGQLAIHHNVHDDYQPSSFDDVILASQADDKNKIKERLGLSGDENSPFGITEYPSHGKGESGQKFDMTIYEAIVQSKVATTFVKFLNKFDDLVELLNSTEANHTLFIPLDSAFEKYPNLDDVSDEEARNGILYHLAEGLYPSKRIAKLHTIPSLLQESLLGDKYQRLRSRAGFLGLRLNFFSKITTHDVGFTNGIIHAVDNVIIPPTYIGKELSLFPDRFSTLLLAYEKTDFVKFIHGVKMVGGTVFAPSNSAWHKLGPRANAFLFNSEKGLKFLTALLKYQISANQTLYSDALYTTESNDGVVPEGLDRYHVDLPTLLGEHTISVDITRWGGLIRMVLNGYVHVAVEDFIARNGVVQVVSSVPIPPRKPGSETFEDDLDEDVSVEDLIERLTPYLDEEDASVPSYTEDEPSDL